MNFNQFVSLKDYKIKDVVVVRIFYLKSDPYFLPNHCTCSMDKFFSGSVNVHALELIYKNMLGYNDKVIESMILPICQLPVREILKSQGTMTVCGCLPLAHCSRLPVGGDNQKSGQVKEKRDTLMIVPT